MKRINHTQQVYELICELTGNKPNKKDAEQPAIWAKMLSAHLKKNATTRSMNTRIMECIDVLQAYSRLEFDTKVRLLKSGDHLNALSLGINMLGEELKASTISLREKETLLKEIHHRVKNNLQIISSLLSLQSTRKDSISSDDIFREARSRIKSIALVHEHLYSSSDLSNIDASKYVFNLVQHVRSIYDPMGDTGIETKLNPVTVNIDMAIPIGLIINELVSNSYKYAFKSNKKKRISIQLIKSRIQKTDMVTLAVSDNGVGFPKGFKRENSDTLGLHLVAMLAEQLNGKMKVSRAGGLTSVSVVFKM
jgi:two-component sensor histidine kinase